MVGPVVVDGIEYLPVAGGEGYVARKYLEFFNGQILEPRGKSPDTWWATQAERVNRLAPENIALLNDRDVRLDKIHEWDRNWNAQHGKPPVKDDPGYDAYLKQRKDFLLQIGYLEPEVPDFKINPRPMPEEVAKMAGSQLVVPLTIERFALNAVNARWGSLYAVLDGFDVIPDSGPTMKPKGKGVNPARHDAVVAYGKNFLDEIAPLVQGSHKDVTAYHLADDASGKSILQITVKLPDGKEAITYLQNPEKFEGFQLNDEGMLSTVLLKNNGLGVEINIDRKDPNGVGTKDPAGVAGIQLESAITVILDGEDSVSVTDPDDKTRLQSNLNGILNGTLTATFDKDGQKVTRGIAPDRKYIGVDGNRVTKRGTAQILIRNVGLHLFSNCMLDRDMKPVPEGLFDIITNNEICQANGIDPLFVQPKIQGPKEARFVNKVSMEVNSNIGSGLMDEEEGTTFGLKNCIEALKNPCFINTGFLDRTGSAIHISNEKGPFLPKAQIKAAPWIKAYEGWNVATGIICGLVGNAQIGKGMWDRPSHMAQMMIDKIAHPEAGANTAWVPSPSAATLHALHYHRVNVADRQADLKGKAETMDRDAALNDIMETPLLDPSKMTYEEIKTEINNNIQSILGYVVRWVDQGIGCSTVPDILGVGRMEDLATLRISRNLIANWLHHGVCTKDDVLDSIDRMSVLVDEQNIGKEALFNWRRAAEAATRKQPSDDLLRFRVAYLATTKDANYLPMSTNLEGHLGVLATRDLVFKDEAEEHIIKTMQAKDPTRVHRASVHDLTEAVLRMRRLEAKRTYGGDKPVPVQELARLEAA